MDCVQLVNHELQDNNGHLASLNVHSVKSTVQCVNTLQYLAKVKADMTFIREHELQHIFSQYGRPMVLPVWLRGNDYRLAWGSCCS